MNYITKVHTSEKTPVEVVTEVIAAVKELITKKAEKFRADSSKYVQEIIVTNWMLKRLADASDEAYKCTTMEKAQQMCAIVGTLAMEYPPGTDEEEQKKWCYCEHPDSKIIAFWYNPSITFGDHGKPYVDPDIMSLPEADDPLVSIFGEEDED